MSRIRKFFSERLDLRDIVALYFITALGSIVFDITLNFSDPDPLSKELPKLSFGKLGVYMIVIPFIIIIVLGIIDGIMDFIKSQKRKSLKALVKLMILIE